LLIKKLTQNKQGALFPFLGVLRYKRRIVCFKNEQESLDDDFDNKIDEELTYFYLKKEAR
jgi:hypothetical protein